MDYKYDLEDLKTLVIRCDDDEDVEDLLLLKYLEREDDLARAALRHRMHVFESLECKDFKNKLRNLFLKSLAGENRQRFANQEGGRGLRQRRRR